jgi:outer membrane cobalamin receptor
MCCAAFSALYGNASGGVININTETGNNRQPWKPAVITAATEHGVTA